MHDFDSRKNRGALPCINHGSRNGLPIVKQVCGKQFCFPGVRNVSVAEKAGDLFLWNDACWQTVGHSQIFIFLLGC